MSWRDQLAQAKAKFRGVEFYVDRHDIDSARRVVVHEYPGSDQPDTEDMGARAKLFDLDAYVLGDDYMTQRDALEAALDKAGSGELVHPYRGHIQVVVLGFRLTESTREGGMARFSIRFVRASETEIRVEIDTQQVVTDTSAVARERTGNTFTVDWAQVVRRDAINAVNAAFAPLENLIGAAEDWRDTLQVIINQPAAIAARLQADLARVANLADFRRLWAYYDDTSEASRSLSLQLQASAAIAACAWSATTTWPSYNEAIAVRDELLAQLDLISQRADDALYVALQDLRVATAADISKRSADLARITRYTPREVLPALVLAHRLYGSADVEARSAELVARNGITHPGFVPVRELEVLSD